jgi:hypothetical protein
MENQEVTQIIDNLKGRRNYEEKKASKLGFSSLYEYFEDKILKEKKAADDISLEKENMPKETNKQDKKCGCC